MTAELQTSTVAKIIEEHAAFLALGERCSDMLLQHLNKGREVGLHLQELKRTSRGDFGKMFTSDSGRKNQNPVFGFTAEHARNFMRFAEAHPDPIPFLAEGVRHMKDAMILAGVLPEQARALQSAHGNLGVFARAKSSLMDFWAIINKERAKEPIQEWPDGRILDVEAQLIPSEKLLTEVREVKIARGL